MVARVPNTNPKPRPGEDEILIVTLTSGAGPVLDQQNAINPSDAVKVALRIISHRSRLDAGDMMTVKKLRNHNEVTDTPRELD